MLTDSRIGLVGGLGLLASVGGGMFALSQQQDTPARTASLVTPARVTYAALPVEEPSWGDIHQALWSVADTADTADTTADTTVDRAPGVDQGKNQDPGGVFQLLRAVQLGYKGPVFDVVEDRAAFQQFFPRARVGPKVPGAKYLRRPDDVVEDGVVLGFPEGVFRLRNLMHYRRWFPKDVTIRGAGMGRTLLYIDRVRSQGVVRNLHIEHCTVFANGPILDLANGLATLRCERVRFIGFDSECNVSPTWRRPAALTTAGAAMHFIECRFEGGYGDTPSEGQLLRGGALIVRFDRCHLSRLRINLPGGRSTVLFDGCVLADLGDDPRQDACHLKTVRFLDCRFENNWLPHTRRRLLCLEALFPDWRKRMVE